MTGTAAANYLHLTFYLVNGSKIQFAQVEPAAAQGILDQLRPERFFSQKQLLISGGDAVTVLSMDTIERVDLRTDPLPDWPHVGPILSVYEIAGADFQRLRRREPTPAAPGHASPAKPPVTVGVQVELHSGAVVFLSVRPVRPGGDTDNPNTPDAPRPEDSRLFFQHLFTRPVLFGTLEDDQGIFLLNPANAVRFTLTPPPPEPSAGSWPMEMLAPNA